MGINNSTAKDIHNLRKVTEAENSRYTRYTVVSGRDNAASVKICVFSVPGQSSAPKRTGVLLSHKLTAFI